MLVFLITILIVYTIYMMQYLPPHSSKFGRIIGIIGFPFIGVLLGFLCDLGVASNAVTWFPVIWIYGGGIGFIGSAIICVTTLVKSINYKQKLSSEKKVTLDSQENNPSFVEGWKNFIHNAFNFKGRTDLKMFSWGILSYAIMKITCWLILSITMPLVSASFSGVRDGYIILGIISIIMFTIAIPLVSLNVRRFRDIGMKTWLNYTLNLIYLAVILIPIVSFIYGIILLIFLCKPTNNS